MATQTIRLSEKNFIELARCELRELMHEVRELITDHDIYWKVQHVIQSNPRLLVARSAFFDTMNDSFAHSAAMRVRRIVDMDHRTISLLRLLKNLVDYPGLLGGQITMLDLENDIRELEEATNKIKNYTDQFVAHHDRNPIADTPLNRELNRSIETIERLFRRYFNMLMGVDIDLSVNYLEDPLAIFRYSWIKP
jgi:hypothetical protein